MHTLVACIINYQKSMPAIMISLFAPFRIIASSFLICNVLFTSDLVCSAFFPSVIRALSRLRARSEYKMDKCSNSRVKVKSSQLCSRSERLASCLFLLFLLSLLYAWPIINNGTVMHRNYMQRITKPIDTAPRCPCERFANGFWS